jgi:hypothetical protein
MQQILYHLLNAQAAARIASISAETAYNKGIENHLPAADLAKITPGRHRLLLKDINQAVDRAKTIAAEVKL